MLILNRFLDVEEYALGDVQAAGKKRIKPTNTRPRGLRVNLVRLATAIAKSMHCSTLCALELPFAIAEQISALQRHTSSVAPNGNLRLKERYFGQSGIRDFSKTTLEGQYAQGLSFLFAQDYLEIPALVDFDLFCDNEGIARLPANASKPDFVGCQNSSGYWLLEAKGNLESGSVKGELKSGLAQCAAGASYLVGQGVGAPQKSYTALSSFRTENSPKSTRVCFVDPSHDGIFRGFDSLAFLRRYYEQVLRALGYKGQPGEIWSNPQAPLFHEDFEALGSAYYLISADDSGGALFWSGQQLSPQRFPEFFSAGVAKEVISTLVVGDVDDYFDTIRKLHERNAEHAIDAAYAGDHAWIDDEFFMDGTVVSATF